MIAHQERHETEQAIFVCRSDAGLQHMRAWLYAERDMINDQWPGVEGEELVRLQGEAKIVKRQIKLLDKGPTIKGEVKS